MMNLRQCFLTKNRCYTIGQKITPKGVMVHSTGANNPSIARYVQPDDGYLGTNKYNNHWNVPNVDKCVHAFIGKVKDGSIATYQTLPWTHRGWHAGTGTKGLSANNTHISFEICEDNLSDKEYFAKIYEEATDLTAYLCGVYNLDPLADGVVICHSEGYKRGIASGHSDVTHWFPKHGKTMDDFRNDVKIKMGSNKEGSMMNGNGGSISEKKEEKASKVADKKDVNKSGSYITKMDLNLRDGPSPKNELLIVMPKGSKVRCYGYYGVDPNTNVQWYYVQVLVRGEIYTGFCHSGYLSRVG